MKHAIRLFALLLTLAAAPPAAQAQQRPEPIISPEVATDHRVTFRIRAPKASEVLVTASMGPSNPKPPGTIKDQPGQWTMPMQKSPDGLWTLSVGPLEPEIYRYAFLIDGVRALDLTN